MQVVLNENNLFYNDIDIFERSVNVLLIDENSKVLIIKKGNTLLLPGGNINLNEKANIGIRRKLLEETGILYEENEIKEVFNLKEFQKNCQTKKGLIFNKLIETTFFIGKFKGINKVGNFELYELDNLKYLVQNGSKNMLLDNGISVILSILEGKNKAKTKSLM